MLDKYFLTNQILTYLGNKRKLLFYISDEIEKILKKLNKQKVVCFDGFSGSGIVSRLMKQYSSVLISNDLEYYSYILNKCYLSNKSEIDLRKIKKFNQYLNNNKLNNQNNYTNIIREFYSPKDDNNILIDDRCFYTNKNALIIDTIRQEIDNIEKEYQKYFLAPLLIESSANVNTCGLLSSFYKDKKTGLGCFNKKLKGDTNRIKKEILLPFPIFSNYECDYKIYNNDINKLIEKLINIDITYLDPPYNQFSYSTNYHLLNTIAKYEISKNISKVSGIPNNINKSNFNNKNLFIINFNKLLENLNSKFIIISYNNTSFLKRNEICNILNKYGKYEIKEINYKVFKGGKAKDKNRNIIEYLFILNKT